MRELLLEFCNRLIIKKLGWCSYQMTIHASIQYHRGTDGQTDSFAITISRSACIGVLTRDKNYWKNRKQYVTINGVNFTILNIDYGVPQGSVLGPFLLCDAMLKRGLCCRPVSLCHVRVVYPDDRREVQLLSWPGSHIILVFWPPSPVPNAKGNPFSGNAKKLHGVGKFLLFSEIAVYHGNGTIYGHGCYWTLIGSRRWLIDPCRFRWPWVTFKGGTGWVKNFQADLNNARTI